MKTSSISDIKNELQNLDKKELLALCLRLAKYKKENKELLNYLLFEATDVDAYTVLAKAEIEEDFKSVHPNSLFFAKKTIRKVLRNTNKYIKYTQSKQVEIELLVCFCKQLKKTGYLRIGKNIMHNMYAQQVKKINAALDSLHEDLQYDYKKMVEEL